MRYYKKTIISIGCVMSTAILLVSILAWVSNRPLSNQNKFSRMSRIEKLTLINATKKEEEIINIAGSTGRHIYFSTNNPNKILVTDHNLKDEGSIYLNIPTNKKIGSNFVSSVDSPDIQIFAGNVPGIITSKLNTKPVLYKLPHELFTRAVKISDGSYIFRGFDSTLGTFDQIFLKGNLTKGVMVKENNVSEKNSDGGISTDGSLHYDLTTNRIIYVHYYKSKFYCLDTNLNLIYNGATIDNTSTEKIIVGKNASNHIVTNLSPKRLINASSCVSDGILFINSTIKSENEANAKLMDGSMIDMYSIREGRYIGSFSVPFYKKEKMGKFKVIGDYIIAFYKGYLVSYQL